MSTGDRTWQCPDCPVNYSGGENLITVQAVEHAKSHSKEITPEQVLAAATPPEA